MSARLRVAAEWEPVAGAIVGWPLILPDDLLLAVANNVRLYVVVPDSSAHEEARQTLTSLGIDAVFIQHAQGLAWGWPRDWGPAAVFCGSEPCKLLDHRFVEYPVAGPGLQSRVMADPYGQESYVSDNLTTRSIAEALGAGRIETGHVLTGGNFLVDGLGTAFSTSILPAENKTLGWTADDLQADLNDLLGIHRHVILPNFEELGIQHLDCVLKVLDSRRLLLAKPPANHSSSPFVEEIHEILSDLKTPSGTPYVIVRIDTVAFEGDQLTAYTNSLILNHEVYVPLYGVDADVSALETWRRVMPGYQVRGFQNEIVVPKLNYKGWQSYDAIHCRIKAVWDTEMLYLSHVGPSPGRRSNDPVEVEVEIVDHSGVGLVDDNLELWYRTGADAQWRSLRLIHTMNSDCYTGIIANARTNSPVDYYFSARDKSGRSEKLPRTAPHQYFTHSVD